MNLSSADDLIESRLLGKRSRGFLLDNNTSTLIPIKGRHDEHIGFGYMGDNYGLHGFSYKEGQILKDTPSHRVNNRNYHSSTFDVLDAQDKFHKNMTRVWWLPAPTDDEARSNGIWHSGRDQLVIQSHSLDDSHVERAKYVMKRLADHGINIHPDVHIIHRDKNDMESYSTTASQLNNSAGISHVQAFDKSNGTRLYASMRP